MAVHDPHVLEYPDVVAILTGHDEYFGLDAGVLKELMGRNILLLWMGEMLWMLMSSLVLGLCIRESGEGIRMGTQYDEETAGVLEISDESDT